MTEIYCLVFAPRIAQKNGILRYGTTYSSSTEQIIVLLLMTNGKFKIQTSFWSFHDQVLPKWVLHLGFCFQVTYDINWRWRSSIIHVSKECQEVLLLYYIPSEGVCGGGILCLLFVSGICQFSFAALNTDTIFNICVWFFTPPLTFKPYPCLGGQSLRSTSPDSSCRKESPAKRKINSSPTPKSPSPCGTGRAPGQYSITSSNAGMAVSTSPFSALSGFSHRSKRNTS